MQYTDKQLVIRITRLWFGIAKSRKASSFAETIAVFDYYTFEFYGPTVPTDQLMRVVHHILHCSPVMNKLKNLCDTNY